MGPFGLVEPLASRTVGVPVQVGFGVTARCAASGTSTVVVVVLVVAVVVVVDVDPTSVVLVVVVTIVVDVVVAGDPGSYETSSKSTTSGDVGFTWKLTTKRALCASLPMAAASPATTCQSPSVDNPPPK